MTNTRTATRVRPKAVAVGRALGTSAERRESLDLASPESRESLDLAWLQRRESLGLAMPQTRARLGSAMPEVLGAPSDVGAA